MYNDKLIYQFKHDMLGIEEIANQSVELKKKIFEDGSTLKIAVVAKFTDDVGIINDTIIYIFNSYIEALECINSFEYSSNKAVSVYEINNESYALLFSKVFDGCCYSRYAHTQPTKYDKALARELYDNQASIYM